MSERDTIQSELEQMAGWASMTAYERTKACCNQLSMRGERIPRWMSIRAIIGKGSSTDIMRGINDFRSERADRLKRMEGINAQLPEQVAQVAGQLWECAIEQARREFEASTVAWQQQIEQAEVARAHQQAETDRMSLEIKALQATIHGQTQTIQTLEDRCLSEQSARDQAERMFDAQRSEMAGQRERLEIALEKSTREIDAMLTRFDGERKHAMLQIDEARTTARRDTERMQNQFALEKSRLENEIRGLSKTLGEKSLALGIAQQQLAAIRKSEPRPGQIRKKRPAGRVR